MEIKRVTKNGVIMGNPTNYPNVKAFLGIRYAVAGRWEYPRMVGKWDGIYDATSFGPTCIQTNTYEPEEMSGRTFYYNEFRKNVRFTYSEDCLRLNIWTPDGASDAPVLVYLHGGAFLGGSTQEKCFDGATLSKRGIVVVTVEFRVGILGFAAFQEQLSQEGRTGNFGLCDAAVALDWVQNNISDFGGNPDNVTLMGQSAGARMVQLLCLSPITEGKFHRAVLLSGGGSLGMLAPQKKITNIEPLWRDVMRASGLEDFDVMKKADNQTLITALSKCIKKDFPRFQPACSPIIDGLLLPETVDDSIEKGSWANVPYLISCTADDLDPVGQLTSTQIWAQRTNGPCYRCHFSRKLPGDRAGAFHSADLWYWFGTLSNCWRPFTEWDHILSNAMITYLVSFAQTGVPEGENLPQWSCDTPVNSMLCFTDAEIEMRTLDAATAIQRKDD